ncbi:hypothetical protein ACIBAG_35615 [Streptomyces sp. NPDC051243]|uniref:hypothetical protein n=1 Tax=Streptomyces sp. NPDC051243 TaxID=3365646 RepID=UPI0037AA22E2
MCPAWKPARVLQRRHAAASDAAAAGRNTWCNRELQLTPVAVLTCENGRCDRLPALALDARREAAGNWETGKTEPRPQKGAAYARLLEGLAARFPAPASDAPAATQASVPEAFTGPEPSSAPAPAAVPPSRPKAAASSSARTAASSRLPGAKKKTAAKKATPAAAAVDPRFENGPLSVIGCEDGQVSAHCVRGLVLDVPAKSIPALVDWTLTEAKLGQARLHRNGRDADPILVLTASALERYGLPAALSDEKRAQQAPLLQGSHGLLTRRAGHVDPSQIEKHAKPLVEMVLLVENSSTRGFTALSAQLAIIGKRLEKAQCLICGVDVVRGTLTFVRVLSCLRVFSLAPGERPHDASRGSTLGGRRT